MKVHTSIVLQLVRNDQDSQMPLTSQSKELRIYCMYQYFLYIFLLDIIIFLYVSKGQCCVLYPFRSPHWLGNSNQDGLITVHLMKIPENYLWEIRSGVTRCQPGSLRKKSFTHTPLCILLSFSQNASRLLLQKKLWNWASTSSRKYKQTGVTCVFTVFQFSITSDNFECQNFFLFYSYR